MMTLAWPSLLLALFTASAFAPPLLETATMAALMPHAAGAGEVRLELALDATGAVVSIHTLRNSPPWTGLLREAVASWSFTGATDGRAPVECRVLVVGLFRPRALFLPAGPGEPPKDVATPSDGLPIPLTTPTPSYPPKARGDGVVIVEARLAADGSVAGATVVQSASAFDDPARAAARRFRFRPAQREGRDVPSVVVLVLGFRQPVDVRGPVVVPPGRPQAHEF
jgi:TonB family protein